VMKPVYAVETRPGFYLPRSKAPDTQNMPKLWVKLKDAERARTNAAYGGEPDGFPRVVVFDLVKQQP